MTLVINVMDERGLINKVIPAKGDKDATLSQLEFLVIMYIMWLVGFDCEFQI